MLTRGIDENGLFCVALYWDSDLICFQTEQDREEVGELFGKYSFPLEANIFGSEDLDQITGGSLGFVFVSFE